jgi:plastocyanin
MSGRASWHSMRALLFPAVLALALAGCASTSTTTTTTTSGMPGMDHMHMAAKTVEVAMKGNKFVNDTVMVYVGDTVKWTNQDMVGHTVTATSGASFDSNPNCAAPVPAAAVCTAPGGTYTFLAEKAGDIAYHCKVHQGMTGKIMVMDHPM